MNQHQKKTKLPLPPEIIVHISKYLNIEDKLNLRLINKSFKFVFDNLIKINCLTIVRNCDIIYPNWFYTNGSNKENNLIEFNYTSTINNLFKKDQVLVNIRKLFISIFSEINLNKTINQLKNLNELNIYHFEPSESNPILSLPKLRILSIQQYHSKAKIIQLNTPSLLYLRSDDLKNYHFNYAEKLIYFDSEFICCWYGNLSAEIEKFKKLEYFISYKFNDKIEFKPNLLTKLIHLKELHFNGMYYEERDLNKLKQIYEYKLKLKLNNLKIFLYGINYDNLTQLDQEQFITNYKNTKQLDLILKNYSKTIEVLSFIKNIDFDTLFTFLNSNPNISLENVARKLPNVNYISASKLNDENIDCFFEFISNYDNLEFLSFTTSINNKMHYLNKLPNLNQRISHLSIGDFDIYESTNLGFLFKFNCFLDKLSLGKIENVDILEYLRIKEITHSINCGLIYRGNNFMVSCTSDEYTYLDNTENKFNELDEMIGYFDELIDNNFNIF